MASVTLGSRVLSNASEPPYFIAEIGCNHQGSLERAVALTVTFCDIDGVDCVKGQFRGSDITASMTPDFAAQPHPNPQHAFGPSYGEHRIALELNVFQWKEIARICHDRSVAFALSVWSVAAVDELERHRVPVDFYKVPSAHLCNWPLLSRLVDTGKPIVVSTGMHDVTQIDEALKGLRGYTPGVVVMHCVSSYPIESIAECRIACVDTLKKMYGDQFVIGYSGHETPDQTYPTLHAAHLGAVVIERHVTLDRNTKGTDNSASLLPKEVAQLCVELRRKNFYVYLDSYRVDDYKNAVSEAEQKCWRKLGISLTTTRLVACGETLDDSNCLFRSPGTGLHPDMCREAWVDGTERIVARHPLEKDAVLMLEDIDYKPIN